MVAAFGMMGNTETQAVARGGCHAGALDSSDCGPDRHSIACGLHSGLNIVAIAGVSGNSGSKRGKARTQEAFVPALGRDRGRRVVPAPGALWAGTRARTPPRGHPAATSF